jgi:hypothetical protein
MIAPSWNGSDWECGSAQASHFGGGGGTGSGPGELSEGGHVFWVFAEQWDGWRRAGGTGNTRICGSPPLKKADLQLSIDKETAIRLLFRRWLCNRLQIQPTIRQTVRKSGTQARLPAFLIWSRSWIRSTE